MEENIPVSVVTGASRGLGLAIRNHLDGYVIPFSRTKQQWGTFPSAEDIIGGDVSNPDDVRYLFSWVKKKFGRLDNLINCAGIASMNHTLLTPPESARRMLETNVLGSFYCIQEATRLMAKRGYGRIVNFSSIAVPLAIEGEAVYCASKSAVEGLTRVIAKEIALFGITVNTIAPNPIKTDLIKGISQEKIDRILGRQAIKRMGTAEDVINVVDFFLRKESSFITGQTIYLGGV